MRFDTNSTFTRQTPFNQLGRNVPVDWSGLVTILQGYNDAILSLTSPGWHRVWYNGQRAILARALAAGYVAGGTAAKTHNGVTYSSLSTTGSDQTDASMQAHNPFPVGAPGTDDRINIELDGTDTISLVTTNRSSVAIWYETHADGGVAWVATNGVAVMSLDSTVPHGGNTNRVPGLVMLRNLPVNATTSITITNVSGTNRIMAIGWLDELPAVAKTVIIGTPLTLRSAVRDDPTLNQIGRAAVAAATEFSEWNVGIADVAASIDRTTDMIPQDVNHPTHQGQAKMAQAFIGARRPSRGELSGAPWTGIPITTLEVNGTSRVLGPIDFHRNSSSSTNLRWRVERDTTTESGSNAGSGLVIRRYSDAGDNIGTSLTIARSSGDVTIGAALAATAGLTTGSTGSSGRLLIGGAAGSSRFVDYYTGVPTTGSNIRWRVQANTTAESGSNAGSDYQIVRYSDTGSNLGNALTITRSTGLTTLSSLSVSGSTITRIRHGTATLSGSGTATVADTTVTANSIIMLTSQVDGGTPGWLRVSARTAGTNFTITSSSATDTSTVGWVMIEP
jgi:hypothetical protein